MSYVKLVQTVDMYCVLRKIGLQLRKSHEKEWSRSSSSLLCCVYHTSHLSVLKEVLELVVFFAMQNGFKAKVCQFP